MSRKLIATDYDTFTGITEEFWFDDAKNTVTIRRKMDVDQLARAAASIRNNNPHNFKKDDGAYRSASIPFIVMENWRTEKGFDWFKSTSNEKKKWLNKSENAHWKLRKGKI